MVIPPHGRSSEVPRGRGVLKVKILEAKYEAKLEFPRGDGGSKTKNLPWGEYGYFMEMHNLYHWYHHDCYHHNLLIPQW